MNKTRMIGRTIIEEQAYCIKNNKHVIVQKGVKKGYMSNNQDDI